VTFLADILKEIYEKAKEFRKKIILPEGDDPRIIKAAKLIKSRGLAVPILIGNPEKISRQIPGAEVIDSKNAHDTLSYAREMYEIRKNKGMTLNQAIELIKQPAYLGAMMVKMGDADGMVCGCTMSTADAIRPALQLIGAKDHFASSFFLMIHKQGNYIFADCGLVANPDEKQLAAIAIHSARSAANLGINPRVAFLSYSTKGSAEDDNLEKIRAAFKLVKQKRPNFPIDGELQFDAAISPDVAKAKCKDSPLGGEANVFIFPDLNSGNIGYKIAEYLGGAKAIGPILQNMNKPVSDLSRGATVEEIVDIVAVVVSQAGENEDSSS